MSSTKLNRASINLPPTDSFEYPFSTKEELITEGGVTVKLINNEEIDKGREN